MRGFLNVSRGSSSRETKTIEIVGDVVTDEEKRLRDQDELLHRQVHPNFIQDGRVTSSAFKPFPRDEGKLSVDRDQLASAQESYELHTEKKQLDSAGTWSVNVGECEELGLPCFEDPVDEPVPDPAHAVIDFTELSKNQRKKYAKKLRDKAMDRGATFRPAS